MKRDISKILNAYLVCALWSSIDDDDEPLDLTFRIDDFTENFINNSIVDINHFLVSIGENNLTESLNQWNDEQLGHDLWLTRNHHGAGFWDRNYKDGDKITAVIHADGELREINLYVTDKVEVDGE